MKQPEEETIQVRSYAPGIGVAVADRTINRKLPDGTRETWGQVAARVALGSSLLDPPRQKEEEAELYKHIAQATLLMSGRHLQHGDATQPNRPFTVFSNCSTAAFSFLSFYLLLNGSGVGRCYDDAFMLVDWGKMPTVECVIAPDHADVLSGELEAHMPEPYDGDVSYFLVPDSREGWAQAIQQIEEHTFLEHSSKRLVLDFSIVRPKGSPIAGMQDRPASGPGPLIHAIREVAKLKGTAMPPWLSTMYVDHYLAECVLVGGARRASRIAIKHWTEPAIEEFIAVKQTNNLWSANNSVAVDKQFWEESKLEGTRAKEVFDKITFHVYYDDTGEPGTVNVDKLQWTPFKEGETPTIGYDKMPLGKVSTSIFEKLVEAHAKHGYQVIVNPCVSGSTIIKTNAGHSEVRDLVDTPFHAVIGDETFFCPGGFFESSISRMIKITCENGNSVEVTPNHQILVQRHGSKVAEWVQARNLSLQDSVILDSPGGTVFPDKVYRGKSAHQEPSANWLGNLYSNIVSIEQAGVGVTYDCSIPGVNAFNANGIIVHNCGEIPLSILGGFCIIADLAPFFASSLEDALSAARVAVRALIRVNTLSSVYDFEVKRTNRIGVGLTGIHEFAWKVFGFNWHDLVDEEKSSSFWLFLYTMKQVIDDEAEKYSKVLGVNIPHSTTCFKPSGSVSKLFNLTEGAHLPARRGYLRWVQFRHDDPLVADYRANGYPVKDLVTYKGTTIVGFPTMPLIGELGMKDKLVIAPEATPEEQYQWLRLLEKYWLTSEKANNISYTLKFDPREVSFEQFQKTLLDGQSSIKCCSVLPVGDISSRYEYLPEENVTEEEYHAILAAINSASAGEILEEDVDFSHIDCGGGACPVDFTKGKI